jgi:predicted phosphodiesterase
MLIRTLVLLATSLSPWQTPDPAPTAPHPPQATGNAQLPDTLPPPAPPLRIFVMADAHSRHAHVAAFVRAANEGGADLVIDAGDMVHDGTAPELAAALEQRSNLQMPWYLAPGNHDVVLRGPFAGPPPAFADFQVAEHGGLRVVLLANPGGRISPEQFAALEAELTTHHDAVHLLVMHVPPFLVRERFIVRLARTLRLPFATPTMVDAGEVRRLTALAEEHRVAAVITGHAHAFESSVRGEVPYVVAGTLGGFLPGVGVPHEYLVLTVDGREVELERVVLARGPREPVGLLLSAFRFLAGVNAFNHAAVGWSFTPSTGLQVRSGVAGTGHGSLVSMSSASFERQLLDGRVGVLAETGAAAGRQDALLQAAGGARLRLLGGYNRNVNVTGMVRGGAGMAGGRAGAMVEPLAGAGVEWQAFTVELQAGRSGGRAILFGLRY